MKSELLYFRWKACIFVAMSLRASIHKHILTFNFSVRTSRGAMKDKTSWFVKLWDDQRPDVFGIGECGPLPGLSIDDKPEFEDYLNQRVETINNGSFSLPGADLSEIGKLLSALKITPDYPSIVFGFETALLDLIHGGGRLIFENSFSQGKPISINGLIWMGGLDFMLQQVEIKIRDGFRCLKLKVGGIDFEKECDVLQYIRRKYFRENIVIRLDANGALKPDEAMYKLQELTRFDIHSIEQPIKPGMAQMAELCEKSPIPVALDESLIGITGHDQKRQFLANTRPKYIILKPTIHGGLSSCAEWIQIANELGIGWWITSALESNIGLNAIAQFTAQYPLLLPQGLGTGQIYANNIESPLYVNRGELTLEKSLSWDLSQIFPIS